MMTLGLGMAVVGAAAWFFGNWSQKAAAAAAADEHDIAGNLANIFGNVGGTDAAVAGWWNDLVASLKTGTTPLFGKAGDLAVQFTTSHSATDPVSGGKNVSGTVQVGPAAVVTVTDAQGNPVTNSAGTKLDHVSVPLTYYDTGIPDTSDNNAGWVGNVGLFDGLQDGTEYAVVVELGVHGGDYNGPGGTPEVDVSIDITGTGAWKTSQLGSAPAMVFVNGLSDGTTGPNGKFGPYRAFVPSGSGWLAVGSGDPTQTSGPTSTGTTAPPTFVGSVLGAFAGAATAATDLPKAIVAGTMAAPHLFWDGMVWATGSIVGTVLLDAAPFLLAAGFILILAGFLLKRTAPRLALRWKALETRLTPKSDDDATRTQIADVNASNELNLARENAAQGIPVVPPPVPAPELPPAPEPPAGPTPTTEVERQLGEPEAIEPTAEEIREMEKNRRDSHPEPEKVDPEPVPAPDPEPEPEETYADSGYDRMVRADAAFRDAAEPT